MIWSFPKTFEKFMSDLIGIIGKELRLKTLDQGRLNIFRVLRGEIQVKTEHSKGRFRPIPKEYFIRTYCYLLCQRQFYRKELREPLQIFRTSAISSLVAQLPYINYSTKPIRLWIKN
jgi:hypothetical protein